MSAAAAGGIRVSLSLYYRPQYSPSPSPPASSPCSPHVCFSHLLILISFTVCLHAPAPSLFHSPPPLHLVFSILFEIVFESDRPGTHRYDRCRPSSFGSAVLLVHATACGVTSWRGELLSDCSSSSIDVVSLASHCFTASRSAATAAVHLTKSGTWPPTCATHHALSSNNVRKYGA